MKLKTLPSKGLIFALLLTALSSTAQADWTVSGKVDLVLSTYLGADNFVVWLEPGWTGTCSGLNDNTVSLAAFFVADPGVPATLNRNFTLATMALATNRTVVIYGLDVANCNANATAIVKN